LSSVTKLNQEYGELAKLGRSELTPEGKAQLKRALAGQKSLLISKAADIAGDHRLIDFAPILVLAFERLIEKGAASDKGCRAKTSIVRALNKLEHSGASVYLTGVKYVQFEASFGPPEDVAIHVRYDSALGLARINHPDVNFILTDLLADNESFVRIGAAKAIAYLGQPEGELLLRLKVLMGQDQVEVIGECMTGLMAMSPKRSLDFITKYLFSRDEAVVESAAIAIGSSHVPEALSSLIQAWDRNPGARVRRSLLIPIALLRTEQAFDYLLGILATADRGMAMDTLSALKIYADDQSVVKIKAVLDKLKDPALLAEFR
jgi:HEAT repeat protein